MPRKSEEQPTKVNLQLEQAIQAVLMDRPIAYHAALAKALGSVTAGVLLSQLLYWQPRTQDADGWFWKTQKEIYDETALSRREHDTARLILKRADILEEKLRGVPARMHYRVNLGKLIELLSSYYSQSTTPAPGLQSTAPQSAGQVGGAEQSSLAESAKLVWRKTPNQFAGKRQTITETTSETTPETRTETTDSSKGTDSSFLRKRSAPRVSKTKVLNRHNMAGQAAELPDDPDFGRSPRVGQGTGGLKPVGELLSFHQAQRLAQVVPETTPETTGARQRRRASSHKPTPWIEQLITDFSSELHDEEHTRQNISQAARLWKESGKSESAFTQLLYEARSLTKQYRVKKKARGPGGELGLRNKMPYYFSVLKDLLGMKADRQSHQSQAPPG